jgi:inosine-uridine nucleoside N-ribohydrolase
MAQRIVILADPGIDGAFAIALALLDPQLDVLGVAATPGNVSAAQATENVRIIVEQLDPPRWPRLGEAPAVEYEQDGVKIHGPGGLGGVQFPVATRHHTMASEKLLIDLVRQYPEEVTVVVLGPLTVLAETLLRNPELPKLVHRIVCLGGAWHEPGNASAVAEFHFYCDPASARRVLRSGAPITLIPLDVARKVLFSPSDLLELPAAESRTSRFLRQIVPYGIRATANQYGIEGFYLKDVLGVVAASRTGVITTRELHVDVETQGELTRGMIVVDARPQPASTPNVDLAVSVDVAAVRDYIGSTLVSAK